MGCLIRARFRPFPLISAPIVQQCCTSRGMLYRMGTVIARGRKDGTTSYLAQITIKRKGKIAHREAQTFLVAFAKSLNAQPQTRQSYMSHLSGIFAIARPMWGYPLDQREMEDAMVVCRKMGITSPGNTRDRRPTLAELDRIMERFEAVRSHRPLSLPMNKVLASGHVCRTQRPNTWLHRPMLQT